MGDIRSPRMQRRLSRNAAMEGPRPSPLAQQNTASSPTPSGCSSPSISTGIAVQVLPMPGSSMNKSINSPSAVSATTKKTVKQNDSPKDPPKPKSVCGPPPPPPPFDINPTNLNRCDNSTAKPIEVNIPQSPVSPPPKSKIIKEPILNTPSSPPLSSTSTDPRSPSLSLASTASSNNGSDKNSIPAPPPPPVQTSAPKVGSNAFGLLTPGTQTMDRSPLQQAQIIFNSKLNKNINDEIERNIRGKNASENVSPNSVSETDLRSRESSCMAVEDSSTSYREDSITPSLISNAGTDCSEKKSKKDDVNEISELPNNAHGDQTYSSNESLLKQISSIEHITAKHVNKQDALFSKSSNNSAQSSTAGDAPADQSVLRQSVASLTNQDHEQVLETEELLRIQEKELKRQQEELKFQQEKLRQQQELLRQQQEQQRVQKRIDEEQIRIKMEEKEFRIKQEKEKERELEQKRIRIQQEQEKQRLIQEEQERIIYEQAKQKFEEEQKKLREEEERKRFQEEERKRLQDEQERKRFQEQERERLQEEQERNRLQEEMERKRLKEVQERKRLQELQERKRLQEEQERKELQEEQERKRIIEQEKKIFQELEKEKEKQIIKEVQQRKLENEKLFRENIEREKQQHVQHKLQQQQYQTQPRFYQDQQQNHQHQQYLQQDQIDEQHQNSRLIRQGSVPALSGPSAHDSANLKFDLKNIENDSRECQTLRIVNASKSPNVSPTSGLIKAPLPWMSAIPRRETSAPPEFVNYAQGAQARLQQQRAQRQHSQDHYRAPTTPSPVFKEAVVVSPPVVFQHHGSENFYSQDSGTYTLPRKGKGGAPAAHRPWVAKHLQYQQTKPQQQQQIRSQQPVLKWPPVQHPNYLRQQSLSNETSIQSQHVQTTSERSRVRIIPIMLEQDSSFDAEQSYSSVANPSTSNVTKPHPTTVPAFSHQYNSQPYHQMSPPVQVMQQLPPQSPIYFQPQSDHPNMQPPAYRTEQQQQLLTQPAKVDSRPRQVASDGVAYHNTPIGLYSDGNAVEALQQMQQSLAQLNSGLQT